MPHIPVLLHEVIALTDPKPGEFVLDGTAGGGGHARAFAEAIGPKGKLLALDLDRGALAEAKRALAPGEKKRDRWPAIFIERGNYAAIPEILRTKDLGKPDILFVDLGFSSFQIDDPRRGFSFREGAAPLDMRYDPEGNRPTAAEVVNGSGEAELADMFHRYGEERNAKGIAHAIVLARRKKKVATVADLLTAIEGAFSPARRRGRTHYATRVFQALRIRVNREFENLTTFLASLPEVMERGGRVAIISFHSLEDRTVKLAFRSLAASGVAASVTKRPVVPSREERERNPRSRSAKLRVLQFK